MSTSATSIVVAGYHVCAIDGDLLCWGKNATGELGNGTTMKANLPVLVTW